MSLCQLCIGTRVNSLHLTLVLVYTSNRQCLCSCLCSMRWISSVMSTSSPSLLTSSPSSIETIPLASYNPSLPVSHPGFFTYIILPVQKMPQHICTSFCRPGFLSCFCVGTYSVFTRGLALCLSLAFALAVCFCFYQKLQIKISSGLQCLKS